MISDLLNFALCVCGIDPQNKENETVNAEQQLFVVLCIIPFLSSRCLGQCRAEYIHQSSACILSAEKITTIRRCCHIYMYSRTSDKRHS